MDQSFMVREIKPADPHIMSVAVLVSSCHFKWTIYLMLMKTKSI